MIMALEIMLHFYIQLSTSLMFPVAKLHKKKTADQICVTMSSQFNFYVDVEFAFLGRYNALAIYRYKGILCRYKGLILCILSENFCE